MKTNFALFGLLSFAVVSCDKKETSAQVPELPRTKTAEFRPVAGKSTTHKTKAVDESGMARMPMQKSGESPPTASMQPPPAIQAAPAPMDPERAALVESTEKLRQERLARMAKAREERVAQMTIAIADRYKQQDANGDGLLAKDEVSGRTQQRFAEVDKNGDGFLDATEQQEMIQAFAQRMSEGGGGRRGGNNGRNNGANGGTTRRGGGNP